MDVQEVNCSPMIDHPDIQTVIGNGVKDTDEQLLRGTMTMLGEHPQRVWKNAEIQVCGEKTLYLFYSGSRTNKFAVYFNEHKEIKKESTEQGWGMTLTNVWGACKNTFTKYVGPAMRFCANVKSGGLMNAISQATEDTKAGRIEDGSANRRAEAQKIPDPAADARATSTECSKDSSNGDTSAGREENTGARGTGDASAGRVEEIPIHNTGPSASSITNRFARSFSDRFGRLSMDSTAERSTARVVQRIVDRVADRVADRIADRVLDFMEGF